MTEEQTDWSAQIQELIEPPEDEAVYILLFNDTEKINFKILGVFTSHDQAERIKEVVVESGLERKYL